MILSQQIQASIIASMLDGKTVNVNMDDMDKPFQEYARWVDEQDGDWSSFLLEFSARSQDDMIAVNLVRQAKKNAQVVHSIDQVIASLPDLAWLWPGWIPRGQITLLAGHPEAGKSYLTLDLARRIIANEPMPDGTPPARAGSVLYVDAENRPMVLKQRLEPWTPAEQQGFFYMLPDDHRMMINFDDGDERDRFLTYVYQVRPALVIIDSYSTITLRGENNKEDVQMILGFLTRVARDYDCAILLIHHLRKKMQMQLTLPGMGGPISLSDVRGSGHIGAMATNAIGLALAGANRDGPRSLQVIKNNLGTHPEPIGVEFHAWEQNPAVAVLSYGPAPALDDDRPQVDQCLDWLIDLLDANGPTPVSEIIEDGQAEGYNERMVYRAKKRAGTDIVSVNLGQRERAWQLRDYTADPPEETIREF